MIVMVPAGVLRAMVALAALVFAIPARADDASPWVRDAHSALRLLAGSRNGPVVLGGIAIQIQNGWKTYWRTPGDSGVPPRFDFSGSDNVEAVTILWPAPMRFPDGAGGESIGYQDQVVLPLRIVAKSADKPITLRATVSYAVCEKLCIPIEAHAELPFDGVASMQDATLAAALDTVPKPATIGDHNPLTVRDIRRAGDAQVEVDVVAPAGEPVDLFVEGPTPHWALPLPRLVEKGPGNMQRFAFALDGLPPGAHAAGAALKLTLVGPKQSYEFNATLD